MQRLCKNGLHEHPGTGYCRECRRAAWRRYARSAKGKAAHRRHMLTDKGKYTHARASAKYRAQMPALYYQHKLLKNRRREALKRLAKRRERRGALQIEG